MLDRLVQFSIRNRCVVIFFVLLVGGLGLRAIKTLPIDAVPDITNVQVQVLTNAPALGPEEVERFITFPIETVMSGLPHLEELRSISRSGVSAVTLVFEEGTDIYLARQLVGERLAEARGQISEVYGSPELGPISTGLGEIYQFEVRGAPACPPEGKDRPDCYSPAELREVLDWSVANQLRFFSSRYVNNSGIFCHCVNIINAFSAARNGVDSGILATSLLRATPSVNCLAHSIQAGMIGYQSLRWVLSYLTD